MRLQVLCQNRMGIAQEILDILVSHEIDLHGIEAGPTGKIYLHFPNLEFGEFQSLMPEIRKIQGVEDVATVPYMPVEREQQELRTLLRTLPEPVISVDPRGNIVVTNVAAQHALKIDAQEAKGKPLKQWIKGFNISKWLNQKELQPQTTHIQLKNHTYLCDINPIRVPEENSNQPVLAGAVFTFKSPAVLGKQMTAYHQATGEFDMIIAESPAMKKLIRQAKKMAQLDAPLLVMGETGTGKEMLAKACHQHSLRRDKPFLALNCASLPDNVAESELFGHGEGAFEGAKEKKGIFEMAEGGTVLLDEIGDLSLQLQTKFLRLLQDGTYRRVGSEEEVIADVRIICSTQKNLLELCQQGEFREDLYYRLNVLTLHIPALRDRRSDIVPMAEHFISRFAEPQRRFVGMSNACRNLLQQYPWPGNVRQLENALLRAVSLLEGETLEPEHLQLPSHTGSWGMGYMLDENYTGTLDEAVKKFEAELLRRLYPAYPSSRQLGKKLGVSHTAIANKLREYGIGRTHGKKHRLAS